MKLNKKNKLLLFGFFLTLYICYAFAFSRTVDYYDIYNSQKAAINNPKSPDYLRQLTLKEKQLNNLLNKHSVSVGASFQNQLLRQLTVLCRDNELTIADFKEPHIKVEKGIKTSSYIFSVEGSFNGALLLINSLENNNLSGFVNHISFTKKLNYKSNTHYLVTEIVLQKNEPAENI
ncbi:MAG: general secretion pathway protein [Flavobacterium sp.]|nr:MAG: general secretion pathway protein [Flavobacterium sp.]